MIDIKVGQTIRISASIWDFCGTTSKYIFVHNVAINQNPPLQAPRCQDISGIKITFNLVASVTHLQCVNCTPELVYLTLGTAYTDSSGMAYINHTVTNEDLDAYNSAVSSGTFLKFLACITGSKGQQAMHECSDAITVLPAAAPSYALDFTMFENTLGLLDVLKNYTAMITAAINELIPAVAGWNVARTEVLVSEGIVRLYLYETGSWSLGDIALFLVTAFNIAMVAVFFILFPFPLSVIFGVSALIVLGWGVTSLIDKQSVLKESVNNFQTKDQNDTRLDQMAAKVLDAYEKSAKTETDCLNKLNGLKISYREYMDAMQKDFSNLYTPAIKRTFESTADSAIDQFKKKTISCERATEIITTAGAIAKSDVSTNFTTVYNINNPYQPPKKEDCWISAPIGEGCILSASTGKWIVGTVALVGILGAAYWFVTRRPAKAKIVIESARKATAKAEEFAKAEYGRAKVAYREIRTPPVPRLTGAPVVPAVR